MRAVDFGSPLYFFNGGQPSAVDFQFSYLGNLFVFYFIWVPYSPEKAGTTP